MVKKMQVNQDYSVLQIKDYSETAKKKIEI